MAEGKGIPTTPTQEKEPDKRPRSWKRLWARTGFGDKTPWGLLQLLIVPLVFVGIGLLFEMHQQIENQRAERERELAEQLAQDEALQAYLDQMSSLLFEKDLRASEEDSEVRTLAQARTLTVISRLAPSHKVDVMRFLEEASLIQGVEGREPIISLTGATLRDADLHFADLRGADLSLAYLSDATLFSAILTSADLHFADLSNATLSNAYLTDAQITAAGALEGATMPNGQKYEDWLKSKGRAGGFSDHSRQTPTSRR